MQQNTVIIYTSTNEYYWKIISKSGHKMDLYPALYCLLCFEDGHLVDFDVSDETCFAYSSESGTQLLVGRWIILLLVLVPVGEYLIRSHVYVSLVIF